MSSTEHAHGDDGKIHSHVSSFNFYLGIFGALIFFTIVTVLLSYIHLGPLNLAIAILIASIKASLVVTFFMHLKYDNKFNAVMFICGLLFIGVFFAYTINDTGRRRNELNDATGNKVYLGESNEKQAPGGFEMKPDVVGKGHGGHGGAAGHEAPSGAHGSAAPSSHGSAAPTAAGQGNKAGH
jgi:cytochrome c oxidase subunit IV